MIWIWKALFVVYLSKPSGRNDMQWMPCEMFVFISFVSFLTQEQYIFVHDAILDAIQSGTTEVAASNLANHFKKLTEFNKGHGDELLEDDFKVSLVFLLKHNFHLNMKIMTDLVNRTTLICKYCSFATLSRKLGFENWRF